MRVSCVPALMQADEPPTQNGGKMGTPDGFCARWADCVAAGTTQSCYMVLPVTSNPSSGNSSTVTIENFVIIQLLGIPETCNGNCGGCQGNNWNDTVRVVGYGIDSLRNFGFGPVRSLVE